MPIDTALVKSRDCKAAAWKLEAWMTPGAVLIGLFLRLDEPPHGTRQGATRDGVNVGQVGAG